MRWALSTDSAPATEPITAAEAKAYSKVEISDDDDLIDMKIAAGRDLAEAETRRAFVTQTLSLWLDGWPAEILLPRAPVQSIAYVKYQDGDGTWQTLSSSLYTTDLVSTPCRVLRAPGADWPSLYGVGMTVRVSFVAGYGAAAAVPDGIKQGIAAYVLSFYDNRGVFVVGTITSELPFSAKKCLNRYRWRDLALTQG